MIVFDFECQKCQVVMELKGDPSSSTTTCPACGGVMIKVFTKPILPITRDDSKRKWGTSRISSSLKKKRKEVEDVIPDNN